MSPDYHIDPEFLKGLNNVYSAISAFKKVVLQGPEYNGKASKIPWSGYWWPFIESADNLYDPGGPLEKYDAYVKKVSGQNSNAVQLEKTGTICEGMPHYTNDPSESWFGHCNGLAAAAVLEPEPKAPIVKQGITFTVGDQKGLMSEAHWYDAVDLVKPENGGTLEAHVFHKVLIDWVGIGKTSVIIDVSHGSSVNNHPIAAYKMQYQTDAVDPSKIHVICIIWCSNYAPKDYVGTEKKPVVEWPNPFGKVYNYWITGDIKDPDNGSWESSSVVDHPDCIWHPDPYYLKYLIDHGKPGCIVDPKYVREIISEGYE